MHNGLLWNGYCQWIEFVQMVAVARGKIVELF
jgi:hypothetical protein